MAEGVRGLSRGSGLLCVLWQPQGTQPLMGQWQCPLFWTGIYEGHLCAPSLPLLLVLFFSLLEEIAEGLKGPQSTSPGTHLSDSIFASS